MTEKTLKVHPKGARSLRPLIAIFLFAFPAVGGCRVTTVPAKIDEYYSAAHELYARVNPVLQEGDIIFRRGHFRLLGGLVNYSRALAWWCESPFCHTGIIYQRVGDTFVIVDTGSHGIKRTFLIDWLIEGPENIAVKRLRPEYRHKTAALLAAAKDLLDRDVLHDDRFVRDDDRFYCSEIVDHCFREIGLPLAEQVRMRDLPNLRPWHRRWFFELVAILAGVDLSHTVAILGNENQGMYASPVLEEVIDLLPEKYHRPPYARVPTPGGTDEESASPRTSVHGPTAAGGS